MDNNNDNQKVRVGILKGDFDDLITEFGRDRSSLRENESLDVSRVIVDEDIVVVEAELIERIYQ